MHGSAGTKVLSANSCPYIFIHCDVDHRAQKAYLSNLSTFRQFACHLSLCTNALSAAITPLRTTYLRAQLLFYYYYTVDNALVVIH